MKAFMTLLLASTFTLAFTTYSISQQITEQVVTALQKNAVEDYLMLFPTLDEFYKSMDEKKDAYGPYYEQAKKDFSHQYYKELIPSVKESFANVISEGEKRGIIWNAIQLVRTEMDAESLQGGMASFTVVFTSDSKEYKLLIDKAFLLNGQLKVGQHLKLI